MSLLKKRGRICLVGCGDWGKNLARNFHELGHLHAVCEEDEARRQAILNAYPGTVGYSRLDDALADPEVDCLAVATPAETHYAVAMQALAAGRDLFVEKPLALEPEEGTRMVQQAERHGCLLMVGHLLRYHPAILAIQEMIARDEIGRLEYLYSNRLSMGKIRGNENALWSFAPHDVSIVLALLGKMPVQVTATGGSYLQPNIADVTVSHLLFDHGVRAHLFVSWLHPYKEQRLVVIGSKKMVVFEDSRTGGKLTVYDKTIQWKNGQLQADKPVGAEVTFASDEPLRMECAHFIECVRERRTPRTAGQEGVQVLEVLQACQRSLQMNGEPVAVQSLVSRRVERL